MQENLPFGDEHILNYVTDFLQQAHAADERYTARDGINIARFAMKLVHGERRRGAGRTKLADRDRADARRRGLAVCPSKLKSNPAACSAGSVRYFPVVPGRSNSRSNCASCCSRRNRGSSRWNCPDSWRRLIGEALARLPEMSVILYSRRTMTTIEPSTFRSSPADPFVEALRTAEEIGAQVIFLEPDSAERPHLPDTYPDTYATRRIGLEKYIEAYRVYPQMRTEEVTAHASAMAWKLQGRNRRRAWSRWCRSNMLDPLLDAMETPQAAAGAREEVSSRNF